MTCSTTTATGTTKALGYIYAAQHENPTMDELALNVVYQLRQGTALMQLKLLLEPKLACSVSSDTLAPDYICVR